MSQKLFPRIQFLSVNLGLLLSLFAILPGASLYAGYINTGTYNMYRQTFTDDFTNTGNTAQLNVNGGYNNSNFSTITGELVNDVGAVVSISGQTGTASLTVESGFNNDATLKVAGGS